MDLGIKNKSATVLASTSGLGFAAARALLEEGARVAISGRDEGRLQKALDQLSSYGDRVRGEILDVTDGEVLRRHLEANREAWGGPDILVVNAGGPPAGTALEVTDEKLDRAYELTLKSAIHAIQTVLPWMCEQGWGRILAMTSSSVRQPIPGLALSNSLRAGLTGYLKTLSSEVARDGVLVNSIATGSFATERLFELFEAWAKIRGTTPEQEKERLLQNIPQGRLGDPEEFGAMVTILVSERASYLNGVALPFDGGASKSLY